MTASTDVQDVAHQQCVGIQTQSNALVWSRNAQKFHDCGLCNQQIHGRNNFTPKSRGFEIVVNPKFFSLHKKNLIRRNQQVTISE